MSKRKKQYYAVPQGERTNILLAARIIVVYYLTLLSIVGVVLKFDIFPLLGPELSSRFTPWHVLLMFLYYVVPFILAIVFGFVCRPFWKNVRNFIVAVLVVHGSYSFCVFAYRYSYLQELEELEYQRQMAELGIVSVSHKIQDSDQDGRVDGVDFYVQFDMSKYPTGDYVVYATLTQNRNPLPDNRISAYKFTNSDNTSKRYRIQFHVDPQKYEPYYARGAFEFNLGVQGIKEVDAEGRQVLAFARWAPFFSSTSWYGQDPEIRGGVIDLDGVACIDEFSIMPIRMQTNEVVFSEFVDDFGRDTNGDGKYDELVVAFNVESKYVGQVFIQTLVEGSADLIVIEKELKKGKNLVEIKVPVEYLYKLGEDGPYTFLGFQVSNQPFECEGAECFKSIKKPFAVYFNGYITKDYALMDFNK
ncbi:MAG: hypothetical protein KAJ18_09375 [Candidatus Omnitrophica bacterium]|nr:hypothetical protein [Candidatus Omnitrophota bacterium]